MNWSPLRLVQKRWKAVYIVGGWIVTYLLAGVFRLIPNDWVAEVLVEIVDFTWIYFATRIFRVHEELLQAPRQWWRMTGRPRAGFVVGTLFALGAVSSIVLWRDDRITVAAFVTWATEYAALAYLYFASSIRLRRAIRSRQGVH